MRILAIQESYVPGGADRSLADLIRNWPIQSDHFTVAVNAGHPRPDFLVGLPVSPIVYESWRDRCRHKYHQKTSGRFRRMATCAETLHSMVKLVRETRPDAAILNNGGFPGGSSLYLALAVLAAFRIVPRIMIIRNYPGDCVPRWRVTVARKMLHVCKADMVAVSRSLTQYLVDRMGLSVTRIHTIYNGVEHPGTLSRVESSISPTSVSLVGSVEERKGHEVLIRALALLSQKYPSLIAVFIGHCDDRERRHLTAIAERLEVERQLAWRSHVDHIDSVFAGVEILVIPSIRQESFGRVAVEAMARGIPVIATDCGGLPEVVEDGVSGIIVSRADPESLADGVDRVLRDSSLRQRLAEGGVARFTSLFSAARMASEYARFLHKGTPHQL